MREYFPNDDDCRCGPCGRRFDRNDSTLSNPDAASEPGRSQALQAAKALSYAPNCAAQSLRTTRSQRIILTVPDIFDPYFPAAIRDAEGTTLAARYSLLIGDTP